MFPPARVVESVQVPVRHSEGVVRAGSQTWLWKDWGCAVHEDGGTQDTVKCPAVSPFPAAQQIWPEAQSALLLQLSAVPPQLEPAPRQVSVAVPVMQQTAPPPSGQLTPPQGTVAATQLLPPAAHSNPETQPAVLSAVQVAAQAEEEAQGKLPGQAALGSAGVSQVPRAQVPAATNVVPLGWP